MQQIKQKFETYLWELFSNGPQNFFILEDEKFVFVNQSFAKRLKYNQDELIGHTLLDFTHPEDQQKLLQCIIICHAKKQANLACRVRLMAKNNSLLYVFIRASRIGDDSIPYLIGTVEDMTEKEDLRENLEKATQNFRSLLNNSPHAIFSLDLDGNITHWNPACETLFGWKRSEVLGGPLPIVPDDKLPEFQRFFQGALKGNVFTGVEVVRKRKDGTLVELSFSTAPIYDENYQIEGYMAITFDMTEEKRIEKEIESRKAELTLSKKRLNHLIKNSFDIIGITDPNGIMLYQSPTFEKSTGYKIEDFVGRDAFELIHPDDHQLVQQVYQDLLAEPMKSITFQCRIQHSDGHWNYFESIATNLLHDSSVKGILFNYWDISEMKEKEKNIEAIRYQDYLTTVGNRRLIEEALMNEIEHASDETMFTYMQLDLDGFKFINDSIGHDYGNLLLKEIAGKLQETFEDHGIVARVGGDEFAILIRNIYDKDVISIEAEKVMSLFQEPFIVEDYEFYVTTSLGVSIYPYSGDTPTAMLKSAELAMYHAKEIGKNQFTLYTPTLDIGTYKTFSLHNDLRKALTNHEFILYFQPRIDSKSNKVISAEALIRWNHPKWGMVSPKEFISIAEKSGAIISIGQWVLENACKQMIEWKQKGLEPLTVSINFSALQFLQADVVEMIKMTIQQFRIDPRLIEIEITESAVLDHEEETLRKIERLKEFGIKIAIDDFGTGYSSLLYLKKLKVDTIKIDRSFIKDLDERNLESQKIASSIIQLAKSLNINVVAEGVETNGQALLLKEMDCDEFQGYLFSKPVPPSEFIKQIKPDSNKEIEKEEVVASDVDKRQFFRIQLNYPLEAEMTLVQISGKKVTLGNTYVLIDNIGPGGHRFCSNIRLPIKPDITLKFNTTILDQQIEVYGKVVWAKELEGGIMQYGLEYDMDEDTRSPFILTLNQLQVKLRQNSLLKNCRFIDVEMQEYFR